jgi:hypothetical protein
MAVYITRSNTVEARQLTGDMREIFEWCRATSVSFASDPSYGMRMNLDGNTRLNTTLTICGINTLNGWSELEARPGDWLVKVFGRFAVFTPHEFETHFVQPGEH